MANVNINQGTQTTIATDLVGTVNYQVIKLDVGTAGASSLFAGTLSRVSTIGTLEVGTVSVGSITNLGSVTNVGTIKEITTVANLTNGSINVTAGTEIITGGTLNNLASGTINAATAVLNSGTINVATAVITTLPNLPQGSIQVTAGTGIVTGGTIQNLVSGTINSATVVLNSGTINVSTAVITTLPNLPQGSINVTAGTVGGFAGSAAAVSGNPLYVGGQGGNGTLYPFLTDTTGKQLMVMTVGTVAAGTVAVSAGTMIQTIGTVNTGTINVATVTAGTITNLVSGTINSATAVLNSGTINVATAVVTVGTITHGTIDAGTVKNDGRPARNVPTYGTTFGGTAAGYATLVGSAGAGTSIWVNDLSIVNSQGGTITCLVGFGTALNGTSVLAKGNFGPREGIEKAYPLSVNAGMTNQDLVAYISAAGTIDVNVSYFISA